MASSCVSAGPNVRGGLAIKGSIFGAILAERDADQMTNTDDSLQLEGMIFSCVDQQNSIAAKETAKLRCNLAFEDGDPWDGAAYVPSITAIWQDGAAEKSTLLQSFLAKNGERHHFEVSVPAKISRGLVSLESTAPVFIKGFN